LVEIASSDINAAKVLYEQSFYSQAVFSTQQAIEKLTKYLVLCLTGIHKIDLQQGKIFALQLFVDQPNRIRKRCIEILSRAWDQDVLLESERIYTNSDITLKKMILMLYNTVGGWGVLSLLIRAVSENDQTVKDLAWSFLQKWREKPLRLFTKPPTQTIDKAKNYYEKLDIHRMEISPHRQKLWDEIRYYLRYD
jgi:hypothetical protein